MKYKLIFENSRKKIMKYKLILKTKNNLIAIVTKLETILDTNKKFGF